MSMPNRERKRHEKTQDFYKSFVFNCLVMVEAAGVGPRYSSRLNNLEGFAADRTSKTDRDPNCGNDLGTVNCACRLGRFDRVYSPKFRESPVARWDLILLNAPGTRDARFLASDHHGRGDTHPMTAGGRTTTGRIPRAHPDAMRPTRCAYGSYWNHTRSLSL